MAAKTFYFVDIGTNAWGEVREVSQPASAATTTQVNLANLQAAPIATGSAQGEMSYGVTNTFNDGTNAGPNAPNGSTGNALRSLNPISGMFAAGIWTVGFEIGMTAAADATATGGFLWKLWKSTDATLGTGAIAITGVGGLTNIASDLTTHTTSATQTTGSATVFNNEYLFITIAGKGTTTDGSGTFHSVQLTLRTGQTSIVTPSFSPLSRMALLGVGT